MYGPMSETSINSSTDTFLTSNTSQLEIVSEEEEDKEEHEFVFVNSLENGDIKSNANKLRSIHDMIKRDFCHQKWSRKSPNKIYLLLYNLIMPFCVITTCGLFAYLFNLPFIFPSLGPTAFLHFAIPNKAPSSPKNTMIGHFVGILSGSVSLQITNLYNSDPAFIEGIKFERIWCSSLSVAICCVLMILLNVEHPPAAATTLIISLGILKTPKQLTVIIGAVLLITIQAFIINRFLRKDAIYPIWSGTRKKNKNNDDDEDDDEAMVSLKGYSKMRLSRMNIKYNKLQNMRNHLSVNNFLEYFEICMDLESDQDMILLIKFAKKNKDKLLKNKNYSKQIPYSTKVLIEHC